MRSPGRTLVGGACVVLASLFATMLAVDPAGGAAARADITPVPGNPTNMYATLFDLGRVGYQQSEVFVSGTASVYTSTAPLAADGKWTVTPTSPAPFTTRAVVYRPSDPKKFNGTVYVEWLNVSGGVEAGPDWLNAHNELIRRGFAWVGVSAQAGGVNATKAGNPGRYSGLSHPGDSYSYDIFSQVGQAVRDQAATMLGGLRPRRVIAAGESQSAIRLTTYVNAVHPVTHVFDGYLLHSRFGGGAALSQTPLPAVRVPSPTVTRGDLDVPVLVVQMETDVTSSFGARQPDSDRYRLWEVPGTAHADVYTLGIGFGDVGDGQGGVQLFQSMRTPTVNAAIFTCDVPINAGPQHWVLQAAVYRLHQWVKKGTVPPAAPRLEVASPLPFEYALDANGNVKGGIRTPHVDAPIATLSGLGQSGESFCGLFGTTVPFTTEQLQALYPTHDKFVAAWKQATNAAVKAGFILSADAREIKQSAAVSTVPN